MIEDNWRGIRLEYLLYARTSFKSAVFWVSEKRISAEILSIISVKWLSASEKF
jgi:hypothetical protein